MAAGPPSAPRYVAIITDGNGRWAKARGLKVVEGHRAGADTVKARLRDADAAGVLQVFEAQVAHLISNGGVGCGQ